MSSRENTGMALGLLGVIIFSLTLPFTRIVVQEIHPLLNGLGRALVARAFVEPYFTSPGQMLVQAGEVRAQIVQGVEHVGILGPTAGVA